MKPYKLVIDGQPSWTGFYIAASDDRDAELRARKIAASYGSDRSFTLIRGDRPIALAGRGETSYLAVAS